MLREIPFSLIQFPLYEFLKKRSRLKNNGELVQLQLMKCGGFAGAISAILTCPIDVVKTRIMTSVNDSQINSNLKNRIIHAIRDIYNTNKYQFFSGVHWRTLYISVGGVCFFGTNEYFKSILGFNTH